MQAYVMKMINVGKPQLGMRIQQNIRTPDIDASKVEMLVFFRQKRSYQPELLLRRIRPFFVFSPYRRLIPNLSPPFTF